MEPVFMQYNDRVHTANSTKGWMADNCVELLEDWPLYSPDLNLVEPIWVHLKKLYHEHYPHLANDTRSSKVIKPLIEEVLIHCWELIPNYLFEALAEAIPRRIEAVIKARGWYIKY